MVRRMWLTIVIAVAIACRYASCCSSSCAFKALYVVQEWQYVMSYCFSRLFSVSQRHCVLSIWNSCWCWCWCLCLCLCYCCSYCFGHHQHYCFLSSPIAVAVIAAMPLDGLIDSVTLVKNLHGLARARASCTFIGFYFLSTFAHISCKLFAAPHRVLFYTIFPVLLFISSILILISFHSNCTDFFIASDSSFSVNSVIS